MLVSGGNRALQTVRLYFPGIFLLRRRNLPGKEVLGRLVDLAVALKDGKNRLGAPFHLFVC